MRSVSFSALRERMLRAGVAPRAVRRIIEELEGHLDDVVAELGANGLEPQAARLEAKARMGSEDTLLESVLARPELVSFARRWPALSFGLVPVLGFDAAFVASIAALGAALHLAHAWFGVTLERTPGLRALSDCFSAWILWVLPTAAAVTLSWSAWRWRASRVWPGVGIAVIAVVGALTNFGVIWATATSRGALDAGIGIRTRHLMPALLRAVSTIAVALLVYIALRRSQRLQRAP